MVNRHLLVKSTKRVLQTLALRSSHLARSLAITTLQVMSDGKNNNKTLILMNNVFENGAGS